MKLLNTSLKVKCFLFKFQSYLLIVIICKPFQLPTPQTLQEFCEQRNLRRTHDTQRRDKNHYQYPNEQNVWIVSRNDVHLGVLSCDNFRTSHILLFCLPITYLVSLIMISSQGVKMEVDPL